MIRKYIFKSPSFKGSVLFGFDEAEQLKFFDNDSEMTAAQSSYLFKYFPFTLEALKNFQQSVKGTMDEIPADLSFEAFWDAYKKKINRKRCEPLWKKMNDTERLDCLLSLKAYDGFLKRSGRAKLDPENYLKRASWENNWNSLMQ